MITADLDRELAAALRALVADGTIPATLVARASAAGSWRPARDADPLAYATALPLEIAAQAGAEPDALAAQLASAFTARLPEAPWLQGARNDGGYLTLTVTAQALASSASQLAADGPDCASSTILAGGRVCVLPWPDPAAAASWRDARQDQADAVTSRLARAAGATDLPAGKRGSVATRPPAGERPPVQSAVACYSIESVRYLLTRTRADDVRAVAAEVAAAAAGAGAKWAASAGGVQSPAHALYPVQQAYASAVSTRRWATDLGLTRDYPADLLGQLLTSPAERQLLSLLSYLPVRVAAAARRARPDELPRYLENVTAAWQACRLEAPALPFGGAAAPREPAVTGARLELSAAVAAVLSAGLALIGITAPARL